ncbi:hypothetical protein OIE63_29045 [Streptomyces sp. NBC_01795]|uniref:hypothetical protein n=1 Tax=Streptomyces sp. NBC_01795 TaxID=2975943 RepID=UPI002DDBFCDF|nr:hypothetical protein [Streptomyces sp. NBC_01795]WSA95149.1 hypothetical protein OIE63_29045 [Streptomyces sp. NBC_01795]
MRPGQEDREDRRGRPGDRTRTLHLPDRAERGRRTPDHDLPLRRPTAARAAAAAVVVVGGGGGVGVGGDDDDDDDDDNNNG